MPWSPRSPRRTRLSVGPTDVVSAGALLPLVVVSTLPAPTPDETVDAEGRVRTPGAAAVVLDGRFWGPLWDSSSLLRVPTPPEPRKTETLLRAGLTPGS